MSSLSSHHELISVSKSYHDTVEIYIRHFLKLIGVSLIPNLITYLLVISLKGSVISAFGRFVSDIGSFFQLTNINFIVTLLLLATMIIVQIIGIVALMYTAVHHERVSIMAAFEHSLEYFWRFVGIGIVLTCITIITFIVGYLIVLLLGIPIGRFSLDLLDASIGWLTLIPVLLSAVVSTFFVFVGYIIVDKNEKIVTSLQYSMKLVRGHFWPIALRLLTYYAFSFIILFALQFIPIIGNVVAVMTVAPFSVVYLYILYHDLLRFKT